MRLWGRVPVPFHRAFPDVNLRCYVRERAGESPARGVVFLREIVPSPLVAGAARLMFNEKFVAWPLTCSAVGGSVRYAWCAGGCGHALEATRSGEWADPTPGSLEEFVTDRRHGFVARRRGGVLVYSIDRPRWQVAPARGRVDVDVERAYGKSLAGLLRGPPTSLLMAEGSAIRVRKSR